MFDDRWCRRGEPARGQGEQDKHAKKPKRLLMRSADLTTSGGVRARVVPARIS